MLKNYFPTNHEVFGNFLETREEVLEGFEDSGILAFSAQSGGSLLAPAAGKPPQPVPKHGRVGAEEKGKGNSGGDQIAL